jgi:hypothetical protein
MTELTVDELIELSTVSAPDVFGTLSTITATATGDGITATVNLEGRLIALELAPHALAAGPAKLAAEIFRLVQEASATALNEGIEILAPVAGEDLATELRALVLPDPAPTPPAATPVRPRPAPEDDFSTVESWAVPH